MANALSEKDLPTEVYDVPAVREVRLPHVVAELLSRQIPQNSDLATRVTARDLSELIKR